jgi:putative peptidoglycan lipid II flippase
MSITRRLSSLFVKSHNLKQAVGILFITVLIGNVLGLLRNIVIANRVALTYGSVGPLDSYYAAFVLPDLLYSVLIVGALSSAILPLLVKIDTEGDQQRFWRMFNNLLSTGLTVIVVGLAVLYLLLPILLPALFPGFTSETMGLTIRLAQVMLLSPLFFTVSQISTSALQAKRIFLAPALAPLIYNAAIIASALLIPTYGLSVLVSGVIIGAAGHFLIQLPSLMRLGWRFHFETSFKDPQLREIIRLMIPRTIALTSTQLLLVVFYRIASNLTAGSIAIYRLTDDLQTAPVLLLGNTLAMAILPDFARHFAKAEHTKFAQLIGRATRLLLFIFLPATAFLFIFSSPLVGLYISLGHALAPAEAAAAVLTFRYFVCSIFFQATVLLLARAYFARSDTTRPTVYSVVSITLAWLLALWLNRYTALGVAGLALAFSAGSFLNAALLWFNLRLPFSELLRDEQRRPNFLLLALGTLLIAAALFGIKELSSVWSSTLSLGRSGQNLLELLLGLVVTIGLYLSWSRIANLEQWNLIKPNKISTEK